MNISSGAVNTFDCIVLSGGGAKGAYAAGVSKALFAYRELKNISRKICYIGTSAGALNASILAAHGPDRLIQFWRNASNKTILGVNWKNTKFQTLLHSVGRNSPFLYVYPNTALEKLISENVQFATLADRHLIVSTTGYSSGRLHAFYVSKLIDTFKATEDGIPNLADRRLTHLEKILNQNTLVRCLLASAAIPFFFPPVEIDGELYIDGGVGNNTPTREAAYFCRYLQDTGSGTPGDVYCVKQDVPGRLLRRPPDYKVKEFILRCLDVYHYIHMEPIIAAWHRINKEVNDHQGRISALTTWLKTLGLNHTQLSQIEIEIEKRLGHLGGNTPRLNVPPIEITPSNSLGDSLDFSNDRIVSNMDTGFKDALKQLLTLSKVNQTEYDALINLPY